MSDKSNTYLYGTEDVPPIPKEVIDARIALLTTHMGKLLEEPYAIGTTRVKAVSDAIDFWEKLR